MTDDTPDDLDSIDLPNSAYRLGVDATGATHYHSAIDRRVWVVADGEPETTFDVDDISHYQAHVADTRGWETVSRSDKGLADTLVDLVEEAIEGGREEVSA